MGITDIPVDGLLRASGKKLGSSEIVYLFGHRGVSDITVTTHDRFGGHSMEASKTVVDAHDGLIRIMFLMEKQSPIRW